MIRSIENLLGYKIAATNGDLGTIEDFYFTDNDWKLQYVVLAVGGWFTRRNVLLSMHAVEGIADEHRALSVNITRESVLASPDIDSDKPVSRQKEILLAEHFGWKPYWMVDPVSGMGLASPRREIDSELPGANCHLRSFREVTSYATKSAGIDGCVTDMIADDESDQILSLVVSRQRRPYHSGDLLPVDEVQRIDWTNRLVHLKSSAAQSLQPFDPVAGINALRTVRFFDYLGNLHHTQHLKEKRVSQ